MKLTSNIASVRQRLRRLQAGIPEAVGKAIDPTFWRGRLEHVAFVTLRAQWALERNLQTRALYERMSQRMMDSLLAETVPPLGSRFTLGLENVALGGALDIAGAADYNLGGKTPSGRPQRYAIHEQASEQNLEATRQVILDWVRLEKRRKARDEGLTDEQIAERIEEILGVSDRAVPRERSELMQAAAGKLLGAIQMWLDGEGESPPPTKVAAAPERLPPEVAASWLSAVMLAWRAYVAAHFRDRVELQLDKLHHRLKTELI